MKSLSAGLVALQTAVRQYTVRGDLLWQDPTVRCYGAGGKLASARPTVQLQDAPIGIAIDQFIFMHMIFAYMCIFVV